MVKYKTAFLCSFMLFLSENETPMWGKPIAPYQKKLLPVLLDP